MVSLNSIRTWLLLIMISTPVLYGQAGNSFQSVPSPSQFPATNRVPAEVKTVATNLRRFGIPFQVNPTDDSFIEVQLFVSRDQGKTWRYFGRQSTQNKEFGFEAENDGEYWFAIKTLNRDRRLVPEGDPFPELKIIVDTVEPELDFRVQTDAAGRIACRWVARDDNISPSSLKLLYQVVNSSGSLGPWTPVPFELKGESQNGVYADQVAWWPDTNETMVNVAIEIRDSSGNRAESYRQLKLNSAVWRNRNESTARITDPAQQRVENPWVSPERIPGPTIPPPSQAATNVSNPKISHPEVSHPKVSHPKVICEGGVCRVIDEPERDLNAGQLASTAKRLARKPQPPNVIPQTGEMDFAAPPAPEGWTPDPQSFQQTAGPIQQALPVGANQNQSAEAHSRSIEWQSETVGWGKENRTFGSGTTRRPQPGLAPTKPIQHLRVTQVPPNPSSMSVEGDRVVGESSTQGPQNQYRGLHTAQKSRPANVTPLPGIDGINSLRNEERGLNSQGSPMNSNAIANQNSRGAAPFRKVKAQPGGHGGNGPWAFPEATNQVGSQAEGPLRSVETSAGPLPSNDKAPIQIIGSKRFRLNYGIDSIDPSGVARVDLWTTTNEGRTWQIWGNDPDNQSPFPVEVKDEGKYGFRVVIHSNDGLTGQGPSSGDAPDMWVLVDTSSPLAKITSVPYGRGEEAGRLVINYSVADPFLTLRPITIGYASNPEGPWNLIGDGIRNEGRFVWKPTRDVPDRIFLRIDAIDRAGNVGTHVLSQSIDVSGLIPRGTIHGVTPVGQ